MLMPAPAAVRERDHRIDVLRGLALLMIFVDHIPDNVLSLVTMHNFGFCDAAEAFVLLAGMSSMLAYGRAFERSGADVYVVNAAGCGSTLKEYGQLFADDPAWAQRAASFGGDKLRTQSIRHPRDDFVLHVE